MKIITITALLLLCLYGCGNKTNNTEKMKARYIAVAEEFIFSQLDSAKKEKSDDGIITIGNRTKTYVINPAKIYTGFINDDKEEDAIITLDTFTSQYQTISEQLIIISSGGKPLLNGTIESDMRILAVKDGIIVAEVPEHSRNSPLFNCPSCREVVSYRFINGELTRIEK